LRLLLQAEEDLEPVGEAGNARDAVFQARTLKPDVILMDVVMPEQSGLDVVPALLHEQPDMKLLVLSMQRSAVRASGVRRRSERLCAEGGRTTSRSWPQFAKSRAVVGTFIPSWARALSPRRQTHRAHIMQELRLSSRAELVRHAYRRGCSTRTRTQAGTASTTRDEHWPSCLM